MLASFGWTFLWGVRTKTPTARQVSFWLWIVPICRPKRRCRRSSISARRFGAPALMCIRHCDAAEDRLSQEPSQGRGGGGGGGRSLATSGQVWENLDEPQPGPSNIGCPI